MFWILCASCLIIPFIMIAIALLWRNNAPKKINFWYGFRTPLTMKNHNTWEFAHKHISKVWLFVGIAVLVLTSIFAGIFHADFIIPSLIILPSQVIVLIASIFPTLIALNKRFNKDGTPKEPYLDKFQSSEAQNSGENSVVYKKNKKLIIITASIISVIVLAIVGVSAGMIITGAKDPEVILRDNNFQVKGLYGITVEYSDISKISLLDKTMREIGVGRRVNGYGGNESFKGNFEYEGIKTYLIVQADTAPTIRIERKNDKDIYISFKSGDATRALFEKLRDKI